MPFALFASWITACRALAEEGVEGVSPIPCAVMEEGDDAAIKASLAENIARLPMDEIDQYQAFAALIAQGRTVEGIASQFGVTNGSFGNASPSPT